MYDVTDAAFRRIIAKESAPDVLFTEFVNVDGLCHPVGRDKMMPHLYRDDSEGPVVAQIWGKEPKNYEKAAALCVQLGFAGVDINMGCPEKSAEKQDACARLITMPERATEIIMATKSGAGDAIPVSVKTRIGYHREQIDTWIGFLLQQDIAALSVHLRTRDEMSKVPARWEWMRRIVAMAEGTGITIIGNGDVKNLDEARRRAEETGCDGVMLGRAVFGNPWLFREDGFVPDVATKLRVMVEHTELFEELFAGVKNFAIMKKHYKAYASGFAGAAGLREKLMAAHSAQEVRTIVDKFLMR